MYLNVCTQICRISIIEHRVEIVLKALQKKKKLSVQRKIQIHGWLRIVQFDVCLCIFDTAQKALENEEIVRLFYTYARLLTPAPSQPFPAPENEKCNLHSKQKVRY